MTRPTLSPPARPRAATSPVTARAADFVHDRRPRASALGRELADLVVDPEAFVAALRSGLVELADPQYAAAQARVAPGVGPVFGVRRPLLDALERPILRALGGASPAYAVYLAERLVRVPEAEARWLAVHVLFRSLVPDPERTWQLARRIARRATDWISVDTLADLAAAGIVEDSRRWAELEQLVYSPHRWERRLVGSVIARLPHHVAPRDRSLLRDLAALRVIASLLGDDEPDVQKALSWALREWHAVDRSGVAALIRAEAAAAAANGDGHRASVLRDAVRQDSTAHVPALAAEVHGTLRGIRKRPGAASTSEAASIRRAFGALPDVRDLPEAPLDLPQAPPALDGSAFEPPPSDHPEPTVTRR